MGGVVSLVRVHFVALSYQDQHDKGTLKSGVRKKPYPLMWYPCVSCVALAMPKDKI